MQTARCAQGLEDARVATLAEPTDSGAYLDHEAFDHSVEMETIIKAALRRHGAERVSSRCSQRCSARFGNGHLGQPGGDS